MSKTWTLDELESLSVEELRLLIPEDIDEQFDKLYSYGKAFIGDYDYSRCKTTCKIYHTREGYINLLNGDLLYIKDTVVFFHV